MAMRKTFSLLAFLPLLAIGQTWAPIGATWTYTQSSCCGPDSTVAVIEVAGDTLIGGQLCRELQMISGWQGCYDLPRFQYQNNDSLFFWSEAGGNFQLLFRWDAEPGDTWSMALAADWAADTLDWTVADTGHVIVDGEPLRTWSVNVLPRHNNFYSPIWLVTERLGPSGSPFTWVFSACDGEVYGGLRCYEDSTLSWLNPQFPQCALTDPVPAAIHFDDPLCQWYVARTYPEGNIDNPNFAGTHTTRYFFSSNMTYNGETWNRLYTQPTWGGAAYPTYMGAVRQADQLVLFLDTTLTIDTLYNFNLQVGDSMRYPDFGAPSPYLTVEAIDTVMIQDYPHRRYHFSAYPQTLEDVFTDTWIEGIGSIHGPLAPRMPATLGYHYGFPDSTRTTCYWRWQDLLWQHPDYPSCTTNILLGIDDTNTSSAVLHPNPTTNTVFLNGLPPGSHPYSITDMLGRSEETGLLQGTPAQQAIDIRALPAGLHLLLIDGAQPISFRLVKE
jgi:hypothetical protein